MQKKEEYAEFMQKNSNKNKNRHKFNEKMYGFFLDVW